MVSRASMDGVGYVFLLPAKHPPLICPVFFPIALHHRYIIFERFSLEKNSDGRISLPPFAEGVATILLAAIIASYLPDNPRTMRQLTEVERAYVLHSLEKEQGAKDDANEIGALEAFTLAVMDPKTWLLMGLVYSVYIAAAVTSFFPSVVGTLGYSRNITFVLTAPPYILASLVMVTNGWHSDKVSLYVRLIFLLLLTPASPLNYRLRSASGTSWSLSASR
jgi:hypothetical protein